VSATRPAGSAARVLIVEDDETIREAVSAALGGAGYEVRAVVDGRDLEAALTGFRPDVVLVDVMLPGRNGFALLEVVRSHTDAGVLMLTAREGSPTASAAWTPAPTTTSSNRSSSPSWWRGWPPCCADSAGSPAPSRSVTW